MRGNGKSDRELTVAHFMPWSGIGGVEIATLRMMEVTQHRFRHVAFCLNDAVALQGLFADAGIETVTYTPPVPSLRHAIKFYKESMVVAHQLRRVGANIVHFAIFGSAIRTLIGVNGFVCFPFRVLFSYRKKPSRVLPCPFQPIRHA